MRDLRLMLVLAGSVALAAATAGAAATLTLVKSGSGVGTIATLPNGVFCGEGCSSATGSLPTGTETIVVAIPSPGYAVSGWSGSCSGHATACALTLDRNRTAQVAFAVDASVPACGATATPFLQAPVPFSDLQSVVPLGNLNAESGHVLPTKHVYLTTPSALDVTPVSIPGAGWITFAHADLVPAEGGGLIEDWEIHLAPCREMRAIFLHVQKLSPTIRRALGAAGWCTGDGSICFWNNLHLRVATGQPLGQSGFTGIAQVDLETYDMRRPPVTFANNLRYRPEDRRFVCPTVAFTNVASATDDRDLVRSRLGGLLGSFDGSIARTTAPRCGTIEQDLPGTAQGAWFRVGRPSGLLEDLQLALAHDNVQPEIPVISLGLSLDGVSPGAARLPPPNRLATGDYRYVPRTSGQINRDFAAVTPTERRVFCFESLTGGGGGGPVPGGVLLLQMTAADKLLVERVTAADCAAARTAGLWHDGALPPVLAPAVRFER